MTISWSDQLVMETKAVAIVDKAKKIKIFDQNSYICASDMWKQLGEMIKEIKDTFDPICDAAHKAHKKAVEKRSKYLDPLVIYQKEIKMIMSNYDAEQERLRKEEEKRLAEIAHKQEEERLLMEAIAAEEEALTNGATYKVANQIAQNIIETPVSVPPIVIPKTTPKLAGGPVFRSNWKFRITNHELVPREYLMIDMVKVGQVARALKKATNIPGIEVYEDRI